MISFIYIRNGTSHHTLFNFSFIVQLTLVVIIGCWVLANQPVKRLPWRCIQQHAVDTVNRSFYLTALHDHTQSFKEPIRSCLFCPDWHDLTWTPPHLYNTLSKQGHLHATRSWQLADSRDMDEKTGSVRNTQTYADPWQIPLKLGTPVQRHSTLAKCNCLVQLPIVYKSCRLNRQTTKSVQICTTDIYQACLTHSQRETTFYVSIK